MQIFYIFQVKLVVRTCSCIFAHSVLKCRALFEMTLENPAVAAKYDNLRYLIY